MNVRTEHRAEDVRIEVDLIVGEPASRAGQYARNVYCEQAYGGTEHWLARWLALDVTADAMTARARVATMADDTVQAERFRRYGAALKRALAGEDAMADAIGATAASLSICRAGVGAPPCATASASADRSISEARHG